MRQLQGMDASFVALETKNSPMHIGNLLIQPRDRHIEVFASHVGLGVNPAVMLAIANRLAQPEGHWQPFAATGCAAFAFPRTSLN